MTNGVTISLLMALLIVALALLAPEHTPPVASVFPDIQTDGTTWWMLTATRDGHDWICALLAPITDPWQDSAAETITQTTRGTWTLAGPWHIDPRATHQPHYTAPLTPTTDPANPN